MDYYEQDGARLMLTPDAHAGYVGLHLYHCQAWEFNRAHGGSGTTFAPWPPSHWETPELMPLFCRPPARDA